MEGLAWRRNDVAAHILSVSVPPATDEKRMTNDDVVADVRKPPSPGKSVTKHKPAEGVDLDLPPCLESGALEAEVEASDPCEEAAERGLSFFVGVLIHCALQSKFENRSSLTDDGRLSRMTE